MEELRNDLWQWTYEKKTKTLNFAIVRNHLVILYMKTLEEEKK